MARPSSSASREQVLAAAFALLREGGAGGLTVRAIAQRAGCSTMAVYTHFDGKAGLVDAIIAGGNVGLKQALDEASRANRDGDVLVSVAMGYREWALTHPIEYQAMFNVLVPDVQQSADTRALADLGFAAHSARVGDELGVDAATASRIARHLFVSVHGHVIFEILEEVSLDDTARTAAFHEAAVWMRKGVA